jgi:predicted nucleotidyltransferase component of viral defense system
MALGDLTPVQRLFLDHVCASDLVERFYLSGGTALSAFHLHHRESEDLDFFSREPFDLKAVVRLVSSIAESEPVPRRVHDRLGFVIRIDGQPLRVEFVRYDFACLEEPAALHGKLRVDGLRDILANKLSALVERCEAKDYVDVFFLLRLPDRSLETAMADCRTKFGWPGLEYLLQTSFLRVEGLSTWPDTDPPVPANEIMSFFRDAARSLIRLDES